MPRSSTTYTPKWNSGKTRVVRVPDVLANDIMEYAQQLDRTHAGAVREPGAQYLLKADTPPRALDTSKPINVSRVPQRSPFRYPGGKTWFIPYLRAWLNSIPHKPTTFIEPFAGGGIASLTTAFEDLASHVLMAESDPYVSSVWKTILRGQGEWLAQEILTFNLTLPNVKAALAREASPRHITLRDQAFLTILRNRVQRGGIMAPGAGLVKAGENNQGVRSRWYPETLARRIREISDHIDRLSFQPGDGFDLINEYLDDEAAVFYVDPPYTKAAKRLYRNWQVDHRKLFELMSEVKGNFLMSYDNDQTVRDLSQEFGFDHLPICMKNTHHAKQTELLISRNLNWVAG